MKVVSSCGVSISEPYFSLLLAFLMGFFAALLERSVRASSHVDVRATIKVSEKVIQAYMTAPCSRFASSVAIPKSSFRPCSNALKVRSEITTRCCNVLEVVSAISSTCASETASSRAR